MKDNGKYTIEDNADGKLITLQKGCIVDYDVLFNEIIGSCFAQLEPVDQVHSKPTDLVKSTVIKTNKKIILEMKVIGLKKKIK